MNLEWVYLIILAAAPFSECRGAILYGIAEGLDPYFVFFVSVLVNILIVPVIFYFLGMAQFMALARRILGESISRKIESSRVRFEKYEELALFGFVAVPMIGTGAWTGALLAATLGLDVKRSFKVIAVGVIISASIVFLAAQGVIAFSGWFI